MTSKAFGLLFILAILTACSSAPDHPVSTQIGTSAHAHGLDIWRDGVPSRPYITLSTARRQAADQGTTYADQEASIAADAAKEGADALIIQSESLAVARVDLQTGRPVYAPRTEADIIKYR